MKNVAVILAGGRGIRLGYDKPKQFLKIAGKLVLEHTLEVFQKHELIDEIVIVCNKDYIYLVEELVSKNQFYKVKKILKGGDSRNESSLCAIKAYEKEKNINLIFHDAVRPLVSKKIITNCIKALQKYNAIDVAIPVTDTIIKVSNNFIESIPPRNELMRGQTPQAFKLTVIKEAYDLALKDPSFNATDDCGVVKKYLPKEKIFVIKGEEKNIKLTYEEDLFLLDKLFQLKSIELSQNELSIKLKKILKNKVIVIFGNSSGIGAAIQVLLKNIGSKVYGFSRSTNNIDIAKNEEVNQALEYVYKNENKIDYVINTAGVLYKEPLANMNYDLIDEIIKTNYIGSINIAKESFKYLKKSQGGLVLFTSSSYTRGRENYSIYSSTKAAIVNLTQALASEWEVFGIKVNCINPERTLTPMRIKNFGCEDIKSLLSAEKVAKVTLNVLVNEITGAIIDVKK